MRTLLQSSRLAVVASWLLLLMLVAPKPSSAATTSTLLSEGFENGIPWDWYNSGFYWVSPGYGGYNGSAVLDMWWYQTGPLNTPALDASIYKNSNDEMYVEFDFFFEYSWYHDWYGFDESMIVTVTGSNGDKELLKLNVFEHYTYYTDGEGYLYEPYTDEWAWRHYKVAIPEEYRTSDMQIAFTGELVWGLSNPMIDNVVIWGTHYTSYAFTPSTLNFGVLSVGDMDTKTVTLKNSESTSVSLSNISITGADAGSFEIVSAPTEIPGGTPSDPGTADIQVRYTSSFGTQTATLGFTGDVDVNQEGAVTLTGTGAAPEIATDGIKNLFVKTRTRLGMCRDTSFVIRNTASLGNLRIFGTTHVEGDNSSEYRVTRLPSQPIPPGGSDTITVSNCPTMEGGRTATLVIESNAGNSVPPILLRGTGILQRFDVTPDQYVFDSVAVGATVCQTFTISNPGSDTLAILQHYFAYADRDFTLVGLEDSLIPPERSREISVCFTPSFMGTRVARLRFVTNIPMTFEETPRDTSDFIVEIMGTGVPFGSLGFSGVTLDSGLVGVESCQTETITNVGLSDLTITSATIAGPDAADFRIVGLTLPLTLRSGQSQNVTLCATPSARGLRNATIDIRTVSSTVPDSSIIPIAFYGMQACAQNDVAILFKDTRVLVGASDSSSVTITNCGDLAATYTAALSSGTTGYALIGNGTSGVVDPGETATFWVRFMPTTRGPSATNLTITTAGVNDIVIPLAGVGAGVTATSSNVAITPTAVGSTSTFTVTVTNEGNIDWTTGAPVFSSAAYSYTGSGATIAPGASETFTVTFAPTAVGPNAATMTFPNASPLETPSLSIALNGEGLSLSVRPTASQGFVLEQNYPNPFTPSTTITFTTPGTSNVRIDLVDVKGELVKTVTDAPYAAGSHQVTLDATDLVSGTYFYVLTSGNIQLVRQMTVSK